MTKQFMLVELMAMAAVTSMTIATMIQLARISATLAYFSGRNFVDSDRDSTTASGGSLNRH
jgi:hypothetical protein